MASPSSPKPLGTRVDLLIEAEPFKIAGLSLGFDPMILAPPLRKAGVLQREPGLAVGGGTLFRLLIQDGLSVAMPVSMNATVTIGTRDGLLLLGVPTVALAFLGGIRPYIVDASASPDGGRLLTLDVPKDYPIDFSLLKIKVSIRLPSA